MNANQFLLKYGISDIEIFAESLNADGKDRVKLSTLLDMYKKEANPEWRKPPNDAEWYKEQVK